MILTAMKLLYLKSLASQTVEKCPHPNFWIKTYRLISTSPMWQGWYLHITLFTLQSCSLRYLRPRYDLLHSIFQSALWGCLVKNVLRIVGLIIFLGWGRVCNLGWAVELPIRVGELNFIVRHWLILVIIAFLSMLGVYKFVWVVGILPSSKTFCWWGLTFDIIYLKLISKL